MLHKHKTTLKDKIRTGAVGPSIPKKKSKTVPVKRAAAKRTVRVKN